MSDTQGTELVLSAKLSELNADQLQQVYNIARRQQEAVIAQSQELGLQIDALRDARGQMAKVIAKATDDLNYLARLIELKRLHGDAEGTAERTVGEFASISGVAPGVVLTAQAKG